MRDDSSYDVSVRIGYLFTKKMTASITAGHQHRDSNLSGLSYDNDYIYFRFDFNYDLGSRGGFSEEGAYY